MSNRRSIIVIILLLLFFTLCGFIVVDMMKDGTLPTAGKRAHRTEHETVSSEPVSEEEPEQEDGPAMILSGEAAADSDSYSADGSKSYEEPASGPFLVVGDDYLEMLRHSPVITQGIVDGLEFSTTDRTFEEKAEDGTVILSATYYEPSIRIKDYTASEQAIRDILTQNVDNIKTEIELLKGEAGAFYTGSETGSYEPTVIQSMLSEGRLDMTCISLVEKTGIRTASSELNTDLTGYTFDTKTGNLLTLDSIADDSDALRNSIIEQIRFVCGSHSEIDFFDRYEELLPNVLNAGNWYLTTKGLVVIVPDSMIAPHTAGVLSFVIPYRNLNGLKGEYAL